MQPISKLRHSILEQLEQQLSPSLSYHGIAHTRDDVLPAAERLAHRSGVTGEELQLLQTAALLHDIGYLYRFENNEPLAADRARKILPDYDYSPEQIETVVRIIMATAMPQRPETLLEQIMCDADLDSLGRDDFWELSEKLYAELKHFDQSITEERWRGQQLDFLEGHRYFTAAAHQMRDVGKAANLKKLKGKIRTERQ